MARRVNEWAKHYQNVWEERSASDMFPAWFRVMALAYGMHKANGHACFEPGSIGMILGSPREDGGWNSMHKAHVQNAIKTAIKRGLLHESSNSRCLVVPRHAIQKDWGSTTAVCPVHGW